VLQGLAAIHDATDEKGRSLGLVHRDISPPNCWSAPTACRVWISHRQALEHIEETAPDVARATRLHVARATARRKLTQRSDVFATGVVIWELLAIAAAVHAGSRKEPASGAARRLSARLAIPTRSAAGARRHRARALSTEPEARFASMHELADAVEAASPPRANARRIAEWVNERRATPCGAQAQAGARRKLGDRDLPLRSGPFAPSWRCAPRRPALSRRRPKCSKPTWGSPICRRPRRCGVGGHGAGHALIATARRGAPPTVKSKKKSKAKRESAALEPAKKGSRCGSGAAAGRSPPISCCAKADAAKRYLAPIAQFDAAV